MLLAQAETSVAESLSSITPAEWLLAGGILVVGGLVAWAIRRIVDRALSARTDSPFIGRLVARLIAYVVFAIALVYSLRSIGVELGPVLALAGVAGLALALGLQDLVENLVAGFYLLARRPFAVGDEIESNGVFGKVRDINLRTTTIARPDGVVAYLPNAMVWKTTILNQTEEPIRRSELSVGVAYDTDLDAAERLLTDAARATEGVVDTPPAFALVEEFGGSSIDFTIIFWHGSRNSERRIVTHRVAKAVKAAFDEAGIEIPFPIRTVYLNNGQND